MTFLTAEEVLAEYLTEFGEEDGQIVKQITDTTYNLARYWRVFLYLFCGPQERVHTLAEASGYTSKLLQNLFWDTTLLRIRQLTDPADQRKFKNLSLER